jgi:hypothetical protein
MRHHRRAALVRWVARVRVNHEELRLDRQNLFVLCTGTNRSSNRSVANRATEPTAPTKALRASGHSDAAKPHRHRASAIAPSSARPRCAAPSETLQAKVVRRTVARPTQNGPNILPTARSRAGVSAAGRPSHTCVSLSRPPATPSQGVVSDRHCRLWCGGYRPNRSESPPEESASG